MKDGRKIGRLAGIMLIISLAGVLLARSYYSGLNASADPRTLKARELYEGYNGVANTGDYVQLFDLLDSIEQCYQEVDHYRTSFEIGVLENNRGAALLTLALYRDSVKLLSDPFAQLPGDSLLTIARVHLGRAISIYTSWGNLYEGKDEHEILSMIEPEFTRGLDADSDKAESYLENRIAEIMASIKENPRRLSVCYTNLGLALRLEGDHLGAVRAYEEAIGLWERNLDAENNLNRLLGKPLKKRNLIQRLFPPDRDEEK